MFMVNKRIWTLSVVVFNGQFKCNHLHLATFITPWYRGRWTSRQRSSEASIDLGQATHGHITADQICLCHTRTKLRRGAVTGGVASSAPMRAGTRVRLICALAHALLMRLSVYWRVGRVMSIRVGVLFRRSTKASECLLRSAAEIAL